jgi:hypothetical protein
MKLKQNVKVKQSHNTPVKAQGERRYSSYSFTTSALDGGEWSASRSGPPVPTGQGAGWVSEPVWTQRLEEKIFCLCRGSNPYRPVFQSVVRHYTDRATRAYEAECTIYKYIVSGKQRIYDLEHANSAKHKKRIQSCRNTSKCSEFLIKETTD